MFSRFFELGESLGVLAAESPKDAGVDQELAERRRAESTENHRGDRIENFPLGLPCLSNHCPFVCHLYYGFCIGESECSGLPSINLTLLRLSKGSMTCSPLGTLPGNCPKEPMLFLLYLIERPFCHHLSFCDVLYHLYWRFNNSDAAR